MKNIAKKALFCASTLILLTACAPSSFEFQRTLKFAEQGDIDSQVKLAKSYYYGENGVKKDYAEALKWFKRSAMNGSKGYLESKYNVGSMYARGEGTPKDFKQARDWLEPIVNHYNYATYNLGVIYYQGGYGIEKDNKKAAHYFEQACKLNHQRACKALDELKKEQ